MRNPGFHHATILSICAILLVLTAGLRAEPPSSAPEVQASKGPPPGRTKPQIIYHVRPASNYAATLHSQEKTQSNQLPIDGDMPVSLQLSRSNANAAAAAANARARQEAAAQKRQIKRPKVEKNRPMRPPASTKSKGHGKGPKH